MVITIMNDRYSLWENMEIIWSNVHLSEEHTGVVTDFLNEKIHYSNIQDILVKKWKANSWDVVVENKTPYAEKDVLLDWEQVCILIQDEILKIQARIEALSKCHSFIESSINNQDKELTKISQL